VSDADGNVRYEIKAGGFKRLCRRARQDVATKEDGSQESGVRRQRTEVRRQKTED
jgi:hypothetical protein